MTGRGRRSVSRRFCHDDHVGVVGRGVCRAAQGRAGEGQGEKDREGDLDLDLGRETQKCVGFAVWSDGMRWW